MSTITGRICLALCLSLIAMVTVFGLDVIGDFLKARSPPGANTSGDVIAQIVYAMAILVGFSWEFAFDGGVEALASTTKSPLLADTVMAILVGVIIVPAWRRHILWKAMILKRNYDEENEAEVEEQRTLTPRQVSLKETPSRWAAGTSRPVPRGRQS